MGDIAETVLDAANAAGAGYADCRVVERTTQTVTVKNGLVNNVTQFEDAGVGVRVLVDGAWGFCGTQR
ncbi:MAG: TldD/PmbA family protein, partial [Candidatus Dormibacteraeota bacterium]|nr:TldD/PmbA family protein [Candidatus Dormibacteraeota bacterium]